MKKMRVLVISTGKESILEARKCLLECEILEAYTPITHEMLSNWDVVHSFCLVDRLLIDEESIQTHVNVWMRPPGTPVYEKGVEEVLESIANIDHSLKRGGIGILLEDNNSPLGRLIEGRNNAGNPFLGGYIRIVTATREQGWKILADKLAN